VGVSLCGAAKNVIAIACGVARGGDFGDNAVALLMTRGLREITRLVLACGGSMDTCLGLAGVGDLDVTCNSPHSRNGSYGEAFAREGITVADYEKQRGMVVEGAHAVDTLLALADQKGIELPIMTVVSKLITGQLDMQTAVSSLMGRDLKRENW
jgi:glycerol-3-phosphate dehydrogenase (NAD(P)+)